MVEMWEKHWGKKGSGNVTAKNKRTLFPGHEHNS